MAIKMVVKSPCEGVFSWMPSTTIVRTKATWPMNAGLRGRPTRITVTWGKVGDHS